MRWLMLSLRVGASLLSVMALLLLVLLAIYASLGRWYMPHLAEQRDTIELYLQENIPVPVQFDTIEGDWRQLSPIVRLQGLETQVLVKDGEWHFHADDVIVEIDVIRSLLFRQPVLRDILIEGGAVSMHGERMSLQGAGENPDVPSRALSELLAAALNIGVIAISDSRVQLNLPDIEQSRSLVVSASLQRRDSFRRLQADLRFDGESPASLSLLVEADQSITGSLNVIELYGRWDNLQLDHWLGSVDWGDDIRIARAISGEVWGYWVPGDDIRLHGRVEAPELALTVKGKSWPVLEQFTTRFVMERGNDLVWDIAIPELLFECDGVAVPWQQLHIQYGEDRKVHLQASHVDLAGMHALLEALGLGGDALASLEPTGSLESVSLALMRDHESGALDWVFRSYLDNVAIRSWHGTPTATGVSGYINVTRQGGYVDLDAGEQFSMGFPNVYANVMHFSSARARVGWQSGEQGVTVSSSLITLQSPEGNAKGLLALDLPKAGTGRDPWMTLVIGLTDAPAEKRNKYIPATISAGLQQWLDDSIGEGQVVRGGFIFDGPLKSGDRKPAVQLFLDVKNTALQYQADWPALHDIDGRLLLDDGHVTVWATSARLYGMHVQDARVEVGDDEGGNLELAVHGRLLGPTADVLQLLGNSPLKKTLGNAFEGWQVDGRFEGDLVLGVSLEAREDPYVFVDAMIDSNRLTLTGQRLQFDDLNGAIGYRSESGLVSEGLEAMLWGKPLRASISSQRIRGGVDTRIKASSEVSLLSVRDWLGFPWMHFAEGETALDAEIRLQPDVPASLQLRSSLQGIAIDLPEPFGKPAATALPLRANIPLGDGLMDIAIGEHARLGVMRSGEEPLQVGLALGHVPFRMPQRDGIAIYGRLAHFDWAAWQEPIGKIIERLGGDVVATDEAESTFRVSGVFVDELRVFDQSYHSVLASVRKDAGRWWIGVQSEEVAGRIGLPRSDTDPYRIELDRLFLAEGLLAGEAMAVQSKNAGDESAAAGSVFPDSVHDLDWREWPLMLVNIQKFKIGKTDFGKWDFYVSPSPDRLRIERLRVSSELLRIDADGGGAWVEWARPESSVEQTRLHASVLVHDIDAVFSALGFDPGLTAKEAVMGFDFAWEGSPLQFDVADVKGTAGFHFKKGFLKTGNRAQTGMMKVLTVFNLDTILRRIQLDFSDLYHQGLAFDEMKTTLGLADGWMTITEPLTIDGPASHLVLHGRVDMVNDTLENRLIVTLPVATSLPWLAAIAGGLPAAVGVYVASKVLEKQVDSFTSVIYDIRGPRTDPQVKFQRLVDADGLLPSWLQRDKKKESSQAPVTEAIP